VSYITLDELKSALRITDQIDDSLLTAAINSAASFVNTHCQRSFTAAGTAITTNLYVPVGRWDPLQIDDALTVTEVAIDEDLDRSYSTVLRDIDYQTHPVNSVTEGIPYPITSLRPQEDGYWPMWNNRATVRVRGRFGWPAVPAPVREATLLQASRLFTRLESPLGVAGFGDMGVMRVSFKGDPDVLMLLAPFRKLRVI
jgi:hypothetical protein